MSASTHGKQNLSQGSVASRSIPLAPKVLNAIAGVVNLTPADAINPANSLLVAIEVLSGGNWHRLTNWPGAAQRWVGNPEGTLPQVTANQSGPTAARLVVESDWLSVGWDLSATP
ncbi:MAG TPA: hypothetical protein VGX76_03440 [Pirellulales bacterium]|nr:hypothetical protein [Pirellulales bacterium]